MFSFISFVARFKQQTTRYFKKALSHLYPFFTKKNMHTRQHYFAPRCWINLCTNSVWTSGFVYLKLAETEEMRWRFSFWASSLSSLYHSFILDFLFIRSHFTHCLNSTYFSSVTLFPEWSNGKSFMTPHELMHYWLWPMGCRLIMFLKMLWHYHCHSQDYRNSQQDIFFQNNLVLKNRWGMLVRTSIDSLQKLWQDSKLEINLCFVFKAAPTACLMVMFAHF